MINLAIYFSDLMELKGTLPESVFFPSTVDASLVPLEFMADQAWDLKQKEEQ